MKSKYTSRCTFLFISLLCFGFPAVAKSYQLIETLVMQKEFDLNVEPVNLIFNGENILLHGKDDQDIDVLTWIDPAAMSMRQKLPLKLNVHEVMFTADQRHILVIGNTRSEESPETLLQIFSRKLELLSSLSLNKSITSLASFVSVNDTLIVYDLATQGSRSTAMVLDFVDRNNPVIRGEIPVPPTSRGVTDFWLLEDGKTVMLNAGFAAELGAFDLRSGSPIDRISYSYSKERSKDAMFPFTVLGLADRPMCRMFLSEGNWASKFLLVSNGTGELVLAGYTPKFRTVDIYSRIPLRDFTNTLTAAQVIEGTRILKSNSLLAGSCDLSVIWAASTESNQFTQYARNPESDFLEKVGVVTLDYAPTAIAVSDSAEFGVAANAKQKKLTVFGTGLPDTQHQRVVGDEDVRALQRLLTERGYLVGTIDGILGTKTKKAIASFEDTNEVKLNVLGSISDVIEVIESIAPEKLGY